MANIPRNILLVDSTPEDRDAIRDFLKTLRSKWNLVVAHGVSAARSHLADRTFDIAVMDYVLEDGSAFDVFPILGETPALIVTAQGSEDIAIECLHRGAFDYLVKDKQQAYLESLPSTMSNVMARKEAELAFVQSEARYQDLYDNAPDMYFQVSSEGTILSINHQGASQLGYTVDELVGSDVWGLVHADDQFNVRTQIDYALEDPKEIHRIEFRQITQQHETIYVAASLSALENPDHSQTVRILCRDVTAQKKAEDYARSLQGKLARIERMESIGLLAGGVAHDLNNILGPVAAYPDLLLESLSDQHDLVPIIKDIRSAAYQAVAIIQDLLTMARQGRQDASPVSINDVIQEYIQSSTYKQLLASHPAVQMDIQLEPELPLVLGLHVNLSKILMNLTYNACESMPEGGKARIETYIHQIKTPFMGYERIPPNRYITVKISDEGIGIPAADQEHMFEPFFSKKGLGQSGSGLGLAVVYGVVKDFRGYIDVESTIDQGTAITVYLPVTLEPPHTFSAGPNVELRGHESLLIVDDLPQQRDLATKLLERLGYQIDTAVHGHDAVERIQAHHAKHNGSSQAYDLILLDMIMEDDFDGLDTFHEILKIYPEQKCIIVSGYAETMRVRQAQSLGALQYLPKPYTRKELGLAVRRALSAE